ncbi:MAG: M81 family metallopeptidase, partial [Betaproteobacteria bacterium]|nr:M81 family metallopeptidase [Betaproteobacteria bacterium]
HANIHADMVELADTVAGYQTYPHIDMHGTALRA